MSVRFVMRCGCHPGWGEAFKAAFPKEGLLTTYSMSERDRLRPLVLELLARAPVASRDGRCTSRIAHALGADLQQVSAVLLALERDGEVTRDVRGRRVFAVHLTGDNGGSRTLPCQPVAQASALRPCSEPQAVLTAEQDALLQLLIDQADAAANSTDAEPDEDVDLDVLARALLRQVVDAATGPQRAARDLAETQQRLASVLDECQRLRGRLRIAEERVASQQLEIDGLRTRAQRAEANLERAVKIDQPIVDRERQLQALSRTMRTRPGVYVAD